MHKDLFPDDFSMEGSVLSLEGQDKEEFVTFVQEMLQWLPKKRSPAKGLLEHPWLCPDSM